MAVDDERIPNFAFPEVPARVFSKLVQYAEWRNRPEGMVPEFDDIRPSSARSLCQSILHRRGPGWLSNEEIGHVLAAFALPFTPTVICRSADEAAKTAEKLGFPVAVKLASSRIVHKTEIGGVQLNLENEAAVRQAFTAIEDRLAKESKLDAMDGVSVQPMISERCRAHHRRYPRSLLWSADWIRARRHSRRDPAGRMFSRHPDHGSRRQGNGPQHPRLSSLGRLSGTPAGGYRGHRRPAPAGRAAR